MSCRGRDEFSTHRASGHGTYEGIIKAAALARGLEHRFGGAALSAGAREKPPLVEGGCVAVVGSPSDTSCENPAGVEPLT